MGHGRQVLECNEAVEHYALVAHDIQVPEYNGVLEHTVELVYNGLWENEEVDKVPGAYAQQHVSRADYNEVQDDMQVLVYGVLYNQHVVLLALYRLLVVWRALYRQVQVLVALYSHKKELHGVQESVVGVLYRLVLDDRRRVLGQACRLAQDDMVLQV